MLTKAHGLPEVYPASMVREHVGNLIAREFGLTTAEPGIVSIEKPLADLATGFLSECGIEAKIRPGFAAGCRYISTGVGPAPTLSSPTTEMLRQATMLYAFDMMSGNPDRRLDMEKPNCGLINGRLFVYDFETCFTGHLLLGPQPDFWRVTELGISRTHIFYPMLKRAEPNWTSVTSVILSLTETRLKRTFRDLPSEWAEEAKRICNHITLIRDNVDKFVLELGMSAS